MKPFWIISLERQVSGGGILDRYTAPVTVVIPCYNGGVAIERAISSVAVQSWRPAEVVIVDDGSSDDTPEILNKLQLKYGEEWVKVITMPVNSGPGAARNAGWDASTQPFVAFLDADDSWHPRKVEIQLSIMLNDPSFALSGHRWMCALSAFDHPLEKQIRVYKVPAWRLLISNLFSTPTVMLRRNIPFRFNPTKRYSEDYLLWLQIALNGHNVAFIDAGLTYLHKPPYGASGLSGHLWRMELGELDTYYRLCKDRILPLPSLPALWTISMAKFLRRVVRIFLLRKLRERYLEGAW